MWKVFVVKILWMKQNPRKPRKFSPSKLTRYTVANDRSCSLNLCKGATRGTTILLHAVDG